MTIKLELKRPADQDISIFVRLVLAPERSSMIPLFIFLLVVVSEATLATLGDEVRQLGRIAVLCGLIFGSMRNR